MIETYKDVRAVQIHVDDQFARTANSLLLNVPPRSDNNQTNLHLALIGVLSVPRRLSAQRRAARARPDGAFLAPSLPQSAGSRI